MNTPQFILASQSPYRAQQLRQLGLVFSTQTAPINEDELKPQVPAPTREEDLPNLSEFLAEQKAKSVLSLNPNSLILAGDQIAWVQSDRQWIRLDKPLTKKKAKEQLKMLSGQTHHLVSSFCLLDNEIKLTRSVTAKVTFRALGDEDIENYIAVDSPLDCAGSYKFESFGPSLILGVETPDPTSILGLPILTLNQDLRSRFSQYSLFS